MCLTILNPQIAQDSLRSIAKLAKIDICWRKTTGVAMKTVNATEVKNKFGAILDIALAEPVMVKSPVAWLWLCFPRPNMIGC